MTDTTSPVTPPTTTQEANLQKPASNLQYVVAVVSMFIIAGVIIVLISLFRPQQDLGIVITAVFGILTPTTLSLLALMKAQETHIAVNSRLSQFIENAKQANIEQGINQGVIQGTDQANARTDALAGNAPVPPVN